MPERCFSVVIPAYNCASSLERLLSNLQAQTWPRERMQILVVDDGSTDGTGEVARRMGADVIRHESNLGRVSTRESGARAARHETLVFIDARLTVGPDLLEKADKLGYLPLMGVGLADKRKSHIDRVFYLIRRRVYRPYEPQSAYGAELWLRPGEFDGRPKGTGVLVIDRQMFLACGLEDKRQDVNDDIRLLHRIVHEGAPILRHTDLSFTYEHRQDWGELLRHTYFRGPKFLDYYLTPGGPLFWPYVGLWIMAGLLLVVCILWPTILPGLLLGVAAAGLAACVTLSEDMPDTLVCLYALPLLASAFALGILSAQAGRILRKRELIRH